MKFQAVNPYGASFFSFAVCLAAFFFPREIWNAALQEDNYAQLDWVMLAYVVACNLALYFGIGLCSGLMQQVRPRAVISRAQGCAQLLPVLIAVLAALFFVIGYLVTQHPGYMLLTVSGEANVAKQMLIDNEVRYTTLIHYAIPVVLWAYYRKIQIEMTSGKLGAIGFMVYLSIFLVLMIAFVNAARYLILPVILGLFVIHVMLKKLSTIPASRHLAVSLRLYAMLLLFVVVVFSLFSFLRGNEDVNDIYASILGYGPVSFNRLAVQLDGKLAFDFSSSGIYVVPEPLLGAVRAVFALPALNGTEVWSSEFDSVAKMGLNSDFIWLTVYGYTFDTLGFFSPVYFLLFGLFVGLAWRSFLTGSVFGIVFYPFAYFSIFFFFGSNYLTAYLQYYLLVFAMLATYEQLIRIVFTTWRRTPRGDYPAVDRSIQPGM